MASPRSRYLARRKAAIAAGTWQPLSDGTAARERVAALRAAGASLTEIADAATLSRPTLTALASGTGQVQAATIAAVLAVDPAAVRPRVADAGGTRLRLRALATMGHAPTRVALAAGVSPGEVREIALGRVRVAGREIREGVAAVYEQWWDKQPAAGDRAAVAARRRAERSGWLAPMALDDDRLDDPAYRPRGKWREPEGTGQVTDLDLEAG